MPPVPVFIYRRTKLPEKPHFLQNHGFAIYTFATFTYRHNILCFLSFQTTSHRAPLLFICFFRKLYRIYLPFYRRVIFSNFFFIPKTAKKRSKTLKNRHFGVIWGFFRVFYTVPRETFSFPNVFSECFT